MNKKQALVELYSKCLNSNYTDMTNETHQLKAKVFATDLGLKYRKIENLVAEAKTAYEQNLIEIEKEAQREKRNAEIEKKIKELQKNAKLAFTVKAIYDTDLKVYRCADGSVFCKENNKATKYEEIKISVKAGSLAFYEFHPSKTVYTGASVGGIAMGGFHTTEAHYAQSQLKTEKGSIEIYYSDGFDDESTIEVESITLEAEIAALFKRVPAYKEHFEKNKAICYDRSDSDGYWAAAGYAADQGTRMELVSAAVNEAKCSYEKCAEIADILNSIIYNDFPASDEDIYAKAIEISETEDIEHLGKAIELFEYIKDYKDSKKYLYKIRPVYDDLVQTQKEQNIIQKEKRQEIRRILIPIISAIVLIALVVSYALYAKISKTTKYQNAVSDLENGNYNAAISAFEELKDYEDSSTLLYESKYQKILHRLEEELDTNSASINALIEEVKSLGDYKDSENIVDDLEIFEEVCNASEITKEITRKAKKIAFESKYITNSDYFKNQVYAYDNLSNIRWKYSSGDPYAISMAFKERKEIRNIATHFSPFSWDTTKVIEVYDDNECIISIGTSDIGDAKYYSSYKEGVISYEGTVMSIKVDFSKRALFAVFDGKKNTLTITVKMPDGSSYSCTYSKIQ